MKLSIITVNYRSFGYLAIALDALQADFPEDWEMIVVDNESLAEPFDEFRARFPWVKCIANPRNSGFGHGCNLGVAQASGQQLLFMNPDVVASCDDINRMREIKAQHDIGILAPQQVSTSGKPQKVFDDFPSLANQSKILKVLLRILMPSRFANPRAHYTTLTECDWVTGSVLLIDHADFDAIGGWSEEYFMYGEDTDLCRKAHDVGLTVAFTPDVEVVHAHGGSSRINVAVKSMTKLEVIISKHVYAQIHTRGFRRWLMHALIIVLRSPVLLLAGLLNVLTLDRIPTLKVRGRILLGLLSYYGGVMSSGSWLSPRAKANQAES